MKRQDVGKVVLGGSAALLLLVALTRKPTAAAPPTDLVGQYLAEIAAATTYAQLDAIRWRFEADYTAGKMTYDQYALLYSAYVNRYYAIVP